MSRPADIGAVAAAVTLGGLIALNGSDGLFALKLRHFTFDLHVWIDHVFSIISIVVLWFTLEALWQWFGRAVLQRRRARLGENVQSRRLFLPTFWASFVLVKVFT